MNELKHNVDQAISDFDDVKAAIEEKGVVVGDSPTSEYGNKVREIEAGGGGGTVITDASYLFYNGARADQIDELMAMIVDCTDMNSMFYSCKDLETLDVSSLDTSKVVNMSKMFAGCSGLNELDLSNFKTSKVTDMSYMFGRGATVNHKVNIDTIDLSSFDTSALKDASYMFNEASGVKHIIFGDNFTLDQATDLMSMFSNCSSLKSLDISKFRPSNATSIANMFNGCSSLAGELDFSGWDTSKVTAMSNIFYNCKFLGGIIGFSAPYKAGLTIGFPKGSSSIRLMLQRLTFKEIGDGYNMRSAIDISYASMRRSGFNEMIASLCDVSSLGLNSNYTKITITGNPCVVDEIALAAKSNTYYATYEAARSYMATRYAGYDYSNAPCIYQIGNGEPCEGVFSDIDEDLIGERGLYLQVFAGTIVIPEEDKLTDDDIAAATAKGWTVITA